jgi:hypothetical protein
MKAFCSELAKSMVELAQSVKKYQGQIPQEVKAKIKELDNDITGAHQFIDSPTDRLSRMVEVLLDIARMGRRGLKLQPVDLEKLVTAVLQTYWREEYYD